MKYVKSTLLKCVIPSALICAAITMTGCLEKPKGTLNISTEPMGLEILVDDELWPMPKLRELLFTK